MSAQHLGRFASIFFVFASFGPIATAQLLVTDRGTNQINQYSRTGEFQSILVGGDPATNGGLIGPSAMTLGPNGDLIVASQFTGSVLRYDASTGDFLGTFAEGLNGPSGLLYDADKDELFVSTLGNFDSELVLRYQASTGDALGEIGVGTGASGRTGLGIGPDDNLYVSSFANGEFFTGAVLQFDGETLAPQGVFALEPFLSGASNFVFRPGESMGTFQLDLVGLFSNNVARFNIVENDGTLAVQDQSLLISTDLDFPSALMDLGDGSMIVTNLGNDNPQTGDLRPGSIARFDITNGQFLDTFIAAGGEGNLSQPTSLLLLPSDITLDCNDDGVVTADDLACTCTGGIDQRNALLDELNLLPGDFNADSEVGFIDFLILSKGFGTAGDYATGDIDCNGAVEFADFLIFSSNFGRSTTAANQTVPEPHAATLFVAGLLGLMWRRRSSGLLTM